VRDPVRRAQSELDTLVTGFRRGALAARRSGRNERFLVGMAFADVSREEIAAKKNERSKTEMSGAAGEGRCREDRPC
jgi:hypothetical protein